MDSIAIQVTSAIQETISAHGPEGLTAASIHAGLVVSGLLVSRETVCQEIRRLKDAGLIASRHGKWVSGCSSTVLAWDKPPRELPYEQWAAYQAGSTPPGTYQPNMSAGWRERWKAKMTGQRSENLGELEVAIRKSVGEVQVKVVVCHSGEVLISANGTAGFTSAEFAELPVAVGEAREAMKAYARHHPGKPS